MSDIVSRIRGIAEKSNPLVPVEINGKKYYTILIHTEQQKFLRWMVIKAKVNRKVKRPRHIV